VYDDPTCVTGVNCVLGGRCCKGALFIAYCLAPRLLPETKTPEVEMLTLPFTDRVTVEVFGCSPIRDFFQISSGEDAESASAFRLTPKVRLVVFSSSDSAVRSITCMPSNPFGRDGDSSRLTSPSSSSSESKTTTSPEFWLISWVEALRI
jgi:hypothetical protein